MAIACSPRFKNNGRIKLKKKRNSCKVLTGPACLEQPRLHPAPQSNAVPWWSSPSPQCSGRLGGDISPVQSQGLLEGVGGGSGVFRSWGDKQFLQNSSVKHVLGAFVMLVESCSWITYVVAWWLPPRFSGSYSKFWVCFLGKPGVL